MSEPVTVVLRQDPRGLLFRVQLLAFPERSPTRPVLWTHRSTAFPPSYAVKATTCVIAQEQPVPEKHQDSKKTGRVFLFPPRPARSLARQASERSFSFGLSSPDLLHSGCFWPFLPLFSAGWLSLGAEALWGPQWSLEACVSRERAARPSGSLRRIPPCGASTGKTLLFHPDHCPQDLRTVPPGTQSPGLTPCPTPDPFSTWTEDGCREEGKKRKS